jgi:hypothetical protein
MSLLLRLMMMYALLLLLLLLQILRSHHENSLQVFPSSWQMCIFRSMLPHTRKLARRP